MPRSLTKDIRKLIRFPLDMLPKNMAVPILSGELKSSKWIVGSQRHAFWLGCYESSIQKRVAKELKKNCTFYDVGANVGFYTLLASRLVMPGLVFAFEPVPRNVSYLLKHLSINQISNVRVFQTAISDRAGKALFREEETGAMGSLAAAGQLSVEVSSIDHLVYKDNLLPPDCIKMDIEGEEHKALLGATNCFLRYKPKLFLATHGQDTHDQCCRTLAGWGYDFEILNSEDDGNRADIFAKPATV